MFRGVYSRHRFPVTFCIQFNSILNVLQTRRGSLPNNVLYRFRPMKNNGKTRATTDKRESYGHSPRPSTAYFYRAFTHDRYSFLLSFFRRRSGRCHTRTVLRPARPAWRYRDTAVRFAAHRNPTNLPGRSISPGRPAEPTAHPHLKCLSNCTPKIMQMIYESHRSFNHVAAHRIPTTRPRSSRRAHRSTATDCFLFAVLLYEGSPAQFRSLKTTCVNIK